MPGALGSTLDDDPLSSAQLRYTVRVPVASAAAGGPGIQLENTSSRAESEDHAGSWRAAGVR